MTTELWISDDDAPKHLGLAAGSIHRWVEPRSLPTQQLDRFSRFKLSAGDEWMRGNGAAEDPTRRDR